MFSPPDDAKGLVRWQMESKSSFVPRLLQIAHSLPFSILYEALLLIGVKYLTSSPVFFIFKIGNLRLRSIYNI